MEGLQRIESLEDHQKKGWGKMEGWKNGWSRKNTSRVENGWTPKECFKKEYLKKECSQKAWNTKGWQQVCLSWLCCAALAISAVPLPVHAAETGMAAGRETVYLSEEDGGVAGNSFYLAGSETADLLRTVDFPKEENLLETAASQREVISLEAADSQEETDLLEGYLNRIFYPDQQNDPVVWGEAAGERLNTKEKALYEYLKAKMIRIAAGEQQEAYFSISSSQLQSMGIKVKWRGADFGAQEISLENQARVGQLFYDQFDFDKIFDALLHDCPYEMYWQDKTKGFAYSAPRSVAFSEGKCTQVTVNSMNITFQVAENYQPAGYLAETPTVDTTIAQTAVSAAAYAQTIVQEAADLGDYEKLMYYKEKICELVSYDDAAADSGNFTQDNDPWQLIHIFDRNPETNVVCEGYSKAFQYLFDLSVFSDPLAACYTVTGTLAGGTGSGGHMWNIVTLQGGNYLVDVTNSDEGTIGSDGSLFLAGTDTKVNGSFSINGVAQPSMHTGYRMRGKNGSTVIFAYDYDTFSLFGTADETSSIGYVIADSILELEAESYREDGDYVPPTVVTVSAGSYALSKVYDGTTDPGEPVEGAELSVSVSGTVSEEEVRSRLHIVPAAYPAADAGDYRIRLSLSLEAGEEEGLLLNSDTLAGIPAVITERKVIITAEDQSVSYTGNPPVLDQDRYTVTRAAQTGGQTGLLEGHQIVSLFLSADTAQAGTGKIQASGAVIEDSQGMDVTDNYDVTYQDGTLTIGKAEQQPLTIQGKPAVVTYGDSFPLTVSGGSGSGQVTWSITAGGNAASVGEASGQITITGISPVTVRASKAGDDNYGAVSTVWSFTPRKKTVQAEIMVEDKSYDGTTDAVLTAMVREGVMGGDSLIISGLKGSFEDPEAGSDKEVVVDTSQVRVEGNHASCYEVIYPSRVRGTITAAEDPNDPTDPNQPEEPKDPADPDQPEDPKDPADPDQPEDPKDPVDPDQPDGPQNPVKPWIFTDVDEWPGNWKYDNINVVYQLGVMGAISGTSLFMPDATLTRAMFATVLYRIADEPAIAYVPKFSDVPANTWYTEAILWANSRGIVDGYTNGSYGVMDPVTREQIAKMLCLFGVAQGYQTEGRASLEKFTDQDAVSSWAVPYMQWAVDSSMISGKPNGDGSSRLDPKGKATRAECAKMLRMFLQKYGDVS